MKNRIAVVFGPTGLVGGYLVRELVNREDYTRVICFSRRDIGFKHEKITSVLDSLTDVTQIADKISGDDLYCCLGTTIKKAGTKTAFLKVDYELPVAIAKAAKKKRYRKFGRDFLHWSKCHK
ncbi:MAG: NAD-dependent epimerase/dehydratase family protein [Bacteroidales bacterium]|nr:NAD-dependent epimerase/dehydratase family protein [Bacteroidales bacterium]